MKVLSSHLCACVGEGGGGGGKGKGGRGGGKRKGEGGGGKVGSWLKRWRRQEKEKLQPYVVDTCDLFSTLTDDAIKSDSLGAKCVTDFTLSARKKKNVCVYVCVCVCMLLLFLL